MECPLKSIPESDLGIKPQGNSDLGRKSGHKPLPAVLDGMDKAEALAYVSRMFDAAQAGAAVWGDGLLNQAVQRLLVCRVIRCRHAPFSTRRKPQSR